MQGMTYEDTRKPQKYCMRKKHVAIICAVVVIVGLVVGLGVGLTRPEPCKETEELLTTIQPPTEKPPVDAGPCPLRNDDSGDWKKFRLPDYVNPIHYDLELQPNMDGDTYIGSTTISIHVSKATKHLWLHIRETKITELPKLQKKSGESLQDIILNQCFEYKAQEYVVVEADQMLSPTTANEEYLLTLKFKGMLIGSLVGFYKTTYVQDGKIMNIAATDHEPTDARKSFPCFDEPNKKATYTISIIHRYPYSALSNMPVKDVVEVESGNKTTFQRSVPMSTYLVCFAVHQFDYVERLSSRGIPLRIYVQPLQKKTAEYAANTTKKIFDYFEDYFNMTYSLPKLDKIAIPDFGTGAMENWGLITYRETNLLYDPEESSTSNKQRVAAVVAHELVHQWFGNIVTMDWWDDLWLNEGFASFFEYIGVTAAETDWQMMDQILIDDVLPVMGEDALLSSHPIVVNVSTPAEITSVFDGISYSKGASILRMLEDWISPKDFQRGCQAYLKKHQFKNAKTDDFWKALEEASGSPVKEVMDTWTRQMGFPVLHAKLQNQLTQQRFLLDPKANPAEPPSELKYKWNIPIKWYAVNGEQNGSDFYNRSRSEITLTNYNATTDGFLKVNKDHLGFYRVQYENQTWENLAEQLMQNHTTFSTADRTGFFDDAFALARADLLDYGTVLNLTKYVKYEDVYLPWERVASSIAYIRNMLEDDNELYSKFKDYWRAQVKPIADELGWNDIGSHLERLLRETVLGLACRMEESSALNNASKLFSEWLNGNSIPPNLRLLVYRYGMQNSGNETSWNYMFEKYKETPLAQEKDKLLYGLASVHNITLLDRFLKTLKNSSLIKSQDVFTVLRYISYNKYGKIMAWDWSRLNWEYLANRYTINDRNLGRLVPRITSTFNTELQLWQMEHFFEMYPEAGAGEIPRQQALETTKTNIEWVRSNRREIQMWLEKTVLP
ncbi:glutamyl aminopeptidase isoform X1 [Latimeria chalumnae]|uniref:glutamyl aminopeptidase isoform X1 n=1 Tax=Latimeria chalumnae TaxID=7897 RepID=UPI00313CC901